MLDWLDLDAHELPRIMWGKDLQKIYTLPDGSFDYKNFMSSVLEHLANYLNRTPYVKKVQVKKDNAVAQKLRKEGNYFFDTDREMKNMKRMALMSYTKSIAYSVPDNTTVTLALAYANRSAALLKLNHPKEALDDMKRAVMAGYPFRKFAKLLYRMGECYQKIATENYIEAKKWLSKVPLNDVDRKQLEAALKSYPFEKPNDSVIDEEDVIPELKSRNEKFPCASDAIDVQYTKKYGRHIVATRDIEIGEILIVEQPYSRFIHLEDPSVKYTHCFYCLKYSLAGIPCDKCVNVIYCSEKCKTMSWEKHHKYDCSVLDVQSQYETPLTGTHGLRHILEAIHEAGGLQQLKERLDNLKKSTDKLELRLDEKWYKKPTLESIFTLCSHTEKVPWEFMSETAWILFRSMYILATTTDFFGVQYDREKMWDPEIAASLLKNPDFMFVTNLLVETAFLATTNALQCEEEDSGDIVFRGALTMPFISLINHSCVMNSSTQFKNNCAVVHATAPIKRGEQMFISYGPQFTCMDYQTRKLFLKKKYYFSCGCGACKERWPKYDDLLSFEQRAKSPEMKKKLKKALSSLPMLFDGIFSRQIHNREKTLEELYRMLRALHEGVDLPCKEVSQIIELLGQFFAITGCCSKIQLPVQTEFAIDQANAKGRVISKAEVRQMFPF